MQVKKKVAGAGTVTYWSLAEWSRREALVSAFQAPRVADLAPTEPPAPSTAVRRALQDVRMEAEKDGRRWLVRPLEAHHGYALVSERAKGEALEYESSLLVVPCDDGSLALSPPDHALAGAVRAACARHHDLLPAGEVGALLAKAAQAIGGVALRPTGGIYWMPPSADDVWLEVAQGVEHAVANNGASAIYVLRQQVEPETLRAVKHACTAAVESEIGRLRQGLSDLKRPSAAERRLQEAEAVEGALREYEVVLDESLDVLRAGLASLKREAAAVHVALMAAGEAASA